MTFARIAEVRTAIAEGVELRGSMATNWTAAYGMVDPSAIPPPGIGQMQRAGVMVTPETMMQADVVFTALRLISNNIIKLGNPHSYVERFSKDGIAYRQFATSRPPILSNTFGGGKLGGRGGAMMQCTGIDRTVWSMALFGEAFWLIVDSDRFLYPSALEVLHPAFMEIKISPAGLTEFHYGTGHNKVVLDTDKVIHIPFKSLPAARRALSPVKYAGIAAGLALAAYEFGSLWFSQGASPSYLLSTDAKLGQEEVTRIAQKFLVEHSGLGQAHLPLVLDNGLKAEKQLSSPDEAQYLQTLEYARSVIGSWFGIPDSRLGNGLQTSMPTPPHGRQEEQMTFLGDTLSGYLVPLEEAFSGLLRGDQQAAFDENKLARPDAQFLAMLITSVRSAQGGSINDIRTRYLGWAPVDGGDDVIAPLASNVSPDQTPGLTGKTNEAPADEPVSTP